MLKEDAMVRVQRMAWPFLCTYLRGELENLEPLSQYKNATTP